MELLEMEIHHLTFQTITLSGFRADNIFQRDRPPTVLCVVFQTTLLAAAWILLRPDLMHLRDSGLDVVVVCLAANEQQKNYTLKSD